MRTYQDNWLSLDLLGSNYEITTVRQLGWLGIHNGELIRASEGRFDVLLTADRHIYHQQNLDGLRLAILVLPTNRLRLLKEAIPAITQSLACIEPEQRVVMDLGANATIWPAMQLETSVEEGTIIRHVFKPAI